MNLNWSSSPTGGKLLESLIEQYPDDRTIVELLWNDYMTCLDARATPYSPSILLRVDTVLREYLTTRQLSDELADALKRIEKAAAAADASSDPDPADGKSRKSSVADLKPQAHILALIEAGGKARDRLRKAIGEFDACLGKGATPMGGLADLLMPLVESAEKLQDESADRNGNGHESKDIERAEEGSGPE